MKKTIGIICAVAILLTMVAGVLGSYKNGEYDGVATDKYATSVGNSAGYAQKNEAGSFATDLTENKSTSANTNDVASTVSGTPLYESTHLPERVVVRDAQLNVETGNYKNLYKSIESKVKGLYGYIANIEEQNLEKEFGNGYAYMTINVPADKLDEFLSFISEIGIVTSKSVTQNDITTSFNDAQSHINSLNVEQETLNNLLSKATSLSDTLEIQDRLTEIRQTLSYYESMMKAMQDDISYSSVTLNITEVDKEVAQGSGFLYDLKTGFKNSLYNIGEGFKLIIIFLVSALPFIAILLVFGIVVFKIFKSIKKKNKKSKKSESTTVSDENTRGEGSGGQTNS